MEKDFEAFKADVIAVIRDNRETCGKGYRRLLKSERIDDIAFIITEHFGSLNSRLWSQFRKVLQRHFQGWTEELNAMQVYYNQSTDYGYCIIDAKGEDMIRCGGRAHIAVHEQGEVYAGGQSYVLAYQQSRVVARSFAEVDAYDNSHVIAYNNARVSLFDAATAYSDGPTTIYAQSKDNVQVMRCLKIQYH